MPKRDNSTGVHVWLVLMKAYQVLHQRAMRSIAGTGLCFSDFAVLETLLHKGPLPVNTIGAKIALTSGSSTAAVDRLEKKGLVRRAADPSDRRTRIVHLNEEGRALSQKAFGKHAADIEAVTSSLTSSEQKTLAGLLKKLGKSAVSGPTTDSVSMKG